MLEKFVYIKRHHISEPEIAKMLKIHYPEKEQSLIKVIYKKGHGYLDVVYDEEGNLYSVSLPLEEYEPTLDYALEVTMESLDGRGLKYQRVN
jgi:hypothetical protein